MKTRKKPFKSKKVKEDIKHEINSHIKSLREEDNTLYGVFSFLLKEEEDVEEVIEPVKEKTETVKEPNKEKKSTRKKPEIEVVKQEEQETVLGVNEDLGIKVMKRKQDGREVITTINIDGDDYDYDVEDSVYTFLISNSALGLNILNGNRSELNAHHSQKVITNNETLDLVYSNSALIAKPVEYNPGLIDIIREESNLKELEDRLDNADDEGVILILKYHHRSYSGIPFRSNTIHTASEKYKKLQDRLIPKLKEIRLWSAVELNESHIPAPENAALRSHGRVNMEHYKPRLPIEVNVIEVSRLKSSSAVSCMSEMLTFSIGTPHLAHATSQDKVNVGSLPIIFHPSGKKKFFTVVSGMITELIVVKSKTSKHALLNIIEFGRNSVIRIEPENYADYAIFTDRVSAENHITSNSNLEKAKLSLEHRKLDISELELVYKQASMLITLAKEEISLRIARLSAETTSEKNAFEIRSLEIKSDMLDKKLEEMRLGKRQGGLRTIADTIGNTAKIIADTTGLISKASNLGIL